MALIGNKNLFYKIPIKYIGGNNLSSQRSNWNTQGQSRNYFASNASISAREGIPSGSRPPQCWVIPIKEGSIRSRTINSSSGFGINGALGRNLDSSIAGQGAFNPGDLSALVDIVASLSASGSVSNATLELLVSIQSSISASGSFSGDISGAVVSEIVSAISASASFSNADVSAIKGALANLAGTGTITQSDANALGIIAANITPFADLSPQSLSQELLDNQDIETGYSMRESLRLILSSLVGKLSGAAGTTVSIRDVNDTVDRIVATVDASGNRTAVTKDVS